MSNVNQDHWSSLPLGDFPGVGDVVPFRNVIVEDDEMASACESQFSISLLFNFTCPRLCRVNPMLTIFAWTLCNQIMPYHSAHPLSSLTMPHHPAYQISSRITKSTIRRIPTIHWCGRTQNHVTQYENSWMLYGKRPISEENAIYNIWKLVRGIQS